MSQLYSPPPADALGNSASRDWLAIDYRSLKTPEAYVSAATTEQLKSAMSEGKLGFTYYDKEAQKAVSVPKFHFVLLEVFSKIDWSNMQSGNARESIYSNLVKDTRTEPLTVFRNGSKAPFVKGIYSQIKDHLPQGAFSMRFVAYCLQIDRIVEIRMSAAMTRGIQKCIAEATKKKWKDIRLFGLTDNDHLWYFEGQKFSRVTKEGDEYAGRGDMYFEPSFAGGVLNPTAAADLHARCCQMQREVRDWYERYSRKNAQYDAQPSAAESHVNNINIPSPAIGQQTVAHPEHFVAEPAFTDDLPF